MAMVSYPPVPWSSLGFQVDNSNVLMNAAGNTNFLIGHVWFPAQSGSKTISSAGGVIYSDTSATITFANAGTNLRVGIQDVDAGGLQDGTFDVFADLVGGGGALTANSCIATPMTNGSKTIGFMDLVAVGMTMTTRAGADFISWRITSGSTFTNGRPYGIAQTGGRTSLTPQFMIKFDDGTFGWVLNCPLLYGMHAGAATNLSFAQNSSPDEYGAALKVPVRTQICGYALPLGAVASADPIELRVFTDPFGTPAAVATYVPDSDQGEISGTSRLFTVPISGLLELEADTWYGFTVRPTSNNPINWTYINSGAGFDVLKAGQPFVDSAGVASLQMIARTDNAGAFAQTQAYHTPNITLHVCGTDTGGGGARSYGYTG